MLRINAIGRRSFLKKSLAGVFGAGLAGEAGRRDAEGSTPRKTGEEPIKIKEYRTLGRTGFKVSDIAAGYIQDDGVLAAALETGVNYIDTAEQYPGHHRVVAKALAGRDRKSLFLTTKIQVLDDKSKAGFLKRARKCLEDLQTDYIDCLMMHMPERVETLKTEGFHEAMRELKAEGRLRFTGVSHHGSFWYRAPEESMEAVLGAAAEDGRFDVFLLAYNFLQMDQGNRILKLCRDKNIGTTLMKTTPVAIYDLMKSRIEDLQKQGKTASPLQVEGLRRYQEIFDKAQEFIKAHSLRNSEEIKTAAIRFCLGHPDVNAVCFIARTYEEMHSFVRISGTRLSPADEGRLDDYRRGCGELYCRHACGLCEPSCPSGVPVNTIARYLQYSAGQGREREAMGLYADIPGAKADACRDCPAPCEAACPYGVPVHGLLLLADRQLSLPISLTS
jgi:predicted aldo/keto reductase-like oxidoreductase